MIKSGEQVQMKQQKLLSRPMLKLKVKNYLLDLTVFLQFPTKKEWTIIFNKVADQWGAFEYNEAEDAVRLKVKPKTGEFEEWLKYEFTKTGDYSANLILHWEKQKVVFETGDEVELIVYFR
ncbi:MAG: DUF2911 domain-containing protein [Ignavibacteriales bacterium]|nr:DUF2911 domain-containing protein [Ignavibacteriales bacterium]